MSLNTLSFQPLVQFPVHIFIVTNGKPASRKGKVQLINASGDSFFSKMPKPLCGKRNELKRDQLNEIAHIFAAFEENKYSRVFDNSEYGFSQVSVCWAGRNQKDQIVYASNIKSKSDIN